jgi:DMSO/TMAO reductase YedYZ molybdopterin-dependent catalytic subunit
MSASPLGPAAARAAADARSGATTERPRVLAPGEVTDYQGQNLDPASSFPEVSIKGPVAVDLASYRLVIDGLVTRPLSLTYAEAASFSRAEKVITLHCVEGWTATALWSGPLLADLVDTAGPDPLAATLVFECADGYTTSLPLADVRARKLILADRINGILLPPERGFPFQVAAEAKWGYKWAKWVVRLTLTDDPAYKGYWEGEGYNINGDEGGKRYEPLPPPAKNGSL